MSTERRQHILNASSDLAMQLVTEGDEDLPRGEIEAAIEAGEVSVIEIVAEFSSKLKELVKK